MGFEPTIPVSQYTAFREQGLQPLGHLSASADQSPAGDVHLNDYGRIVKIYEPGQHNAASNLRDLKFLIAHIEFNVGLHGEPHFLPRSRGSPC